MKLVEAYTHSQTLTLNGERAFEELYSRLARWSEEARRHLESSESIDFTVADELLEKCVSCLGYMDQLIDVSQNYEIASQILSLHRFAIGALVKAKSEHSASSLDGLAQVFASLSEIFTVIRTGSASEPLH